MKESEGGCGVIGVASAEKIAGKHLLTGLCQMRNRGNGKGGGIAAAGLDPTFFGITQEILDQDYLLGIAYLDPSSRKELERDYIYSVFEVDHVHEMQATVIYFVRLKGGNEETVYQNMHRINQKFYSAKGEKRAFVLSTGKDLLVLKIVGYGDDVIRYYQLEELKAHVWIGHHRYPTKGNVWHPGGAHPFVGLNEALVHNGDFANYYSLCEYLSQKGLNPHFLTDTEVAALLFDLLHRTYNYPLEHVIEAFAPTTERDFFLLPEEKKKVYRDLQRKHIHGSPDGPWFFLLAQSLKGIYRLIGITDTSMLRPQVFAMGKNIGFAASEKQAIDAVVKELQCPIDDYWNARGGSHTDGGAFTFTIDAGKVICTDKFGNQIEKKGRVYPFHEEPSDAKKCLDAKGIIEEYKRGMRHFVFSDARGERFLGSGLGPNTEGVELHFYGSTGDYLASGIDGAHIYVYNDAQDQVGQIMKSGLLVIYGNVGQAFLYGAKGGESYVLGSAAGRALINAVGSPRVVINGLALDYLAESFMASDGFVILNGITFDENGKIIELDTPYAGGNLFSLASGGAIYIRDPKNKVDTGQLNGSEFVEMTEEDWNLILPYLKKNESFFNIPIERLLSYEQKAFHFKQVYRKLVPIKKSRDRINGDL
ncbi:MAG: hypothetical protein P4L16_08415 [Chlamydiales bacterium]|nr:hypothetical protein [Chlamydiales bacterium]